MTDNAGPLLCRAGLLTQTQLKSAYETLSRSGGTLPEVLIATGILDEEQLPTEFAADLEHRLGNIHLVRMQPAVAPFEIAQRFQPGYREAADRHIPQSRRSIDDVEWAVENELDPVLSG